MFKGKTIILGVSGGIAAFKAASLCSQLTQAGANVNVVMTENAMKFITPLTFQALSHNAVMCDTFDEANPRYISHIHYADAADLMIIAPATAQTISKMANGMGDNMLTNMFLAIKNFDKVILCPAMNVNMFHNPFVKRNLDELRKLGVNVLDPAVGYLACGYEDEGKLPSTEVILTKCNQVLATLS